MGKRTLDISLVFTFRKLCVKDHGIERGEKSEMYRVSPKKVTEF